MALLRGSAVAPGIAIASIVLADEHPLPEIDSAPSLRGAGDEHARLDSAVERARHQIGKLRRKLDSFPEEGREEIAALLEVYERMLGRSRLLRGAHARLDTGPLTAEQAVQAESVALMDAAGPLPGMSEEEQDAASRRAGEFQEIARRLLRNLTGVSFRAFTSLPQGCVLGLDQLRPADAALINPAHFAAVVSESGGSTDHAAIMLRALNIPSVMAVAGLSDAVRDGDLVIVNGATGQVVANPDEAALGLARAQMEEEARLRRGVSRLRRQPGRLADGEPVTLLANMELPSEVSNIRHNGAQGIGLLRSEFLFESEGSLPGEDAQYEAYAGVIAAMDGQPVTIRVLDWGGDKGVERLRSLGYDVPDAGGGALGLRGLRLLLAHPEILETQLAALLRVSLDGPISIMLPMVTSVTEIALCRDIYEKAARRLRRRGVKLSGRLPPLGVMVETPAAAVSADLLVQNAEFLSIGTNDLTMYTLAVDRGTGFGSEQYSALHPAVMRLLEATVTAALRAHRPVSICGEIASNPRVVALLVGMGLRTFSMAPSSIPGVKKALRAVSLEACEALYREVMAESEPAALRALVEGWVPGAPI